MDEREPRAKVFISCGQAKETSEVDIAHRVAERLREIGFDPYIAVEQQTLRGLKENILAELETSEYLVFIDFKREKLLSSKGELWRGSLFSHQELAIASYLDMPSLVFQQEGVEREAGIMQFLQGNAIRFKDSHLLPGVVADEVRRRPWIPTWKNELSLERDPSEHSDAMPLGYLKEQPARFFHIAVRNRHLRKAALNCYVYLERAHNVSTGQHLRFHTIEFKWAGYTMPNANICPDSTRDFDAFFLYHGEPSRLRFNVYTDASDYLPDISGPGEFDLTYAVFSENFRPVRRRFRVSVGHRLEETSLAAL